MLRNNNENIKEEKRKLLVLLLLLPFSPWMMMNNDDRLRLYELTGLAAGMRASEQAKKGSQKIHSIDLLLDFVWAIWLVSKKKHKQTKDVVV